MNLLRRALAWAVLSVACVWLIVAAADLRAQVPVPGQQSYCMALASGTMAAGLAGGSTIASWRYGGANLGLLRRVILSADDVVAFTAGTAEFDLFAARAFTASDSGGNAATLTGNNGKLRTSSPSTGVADFRVSSTAALSAGTRTLDATPLGRFVVPVTAVANISMVPPSTPIFEAASPAVFAPNEGFVLQATVPATGTWTFTATVCWDEAPTATP